MARWETNPPWRSTCLVRSEAPTKLLFPALRTLPLTNETFSAPIEPSGGSAGDSDDNALAETVNGLDKAEAIRRRERSAPFVRD